MNQGNRISKLTDGGQKIPEKNPPTRIALSKSSKIPEKTKFTLQYDSVRNKMSTKSVDKRITKVLNSNDAQLQKNAKTDAGNPALQKRTTRFPTTSVTPVTSSPRRDVRPTATKLNEERKAKPTAASTPFIVSSTKMVKSSSVTYNKVAIVKKTTRCPATKKLPQDAKPCEPPPKPEHGSGGCENVQKYQSKSRSKIEIKTNMTKMTTLKKSTTYPPTRKVPETATGDLRCRKNCIGCKEFVDCRCAEKIADVPRGISGMTRSMDDWKIGKTREATLSREVRKMKSEGHSLKVQRYDNIPESNLSVSYGLARITDDISKKKAPKQNFALDSGYATDFPSGEAHPRNPEVSLPRAEQADDLPRSAPSCTADEIFTEDPAFGKNQTFEVRNVTLEVTRQQVTDNEDALRLKANYPSAVGFENRSLDTETSSGDLSPSTPETNDYETESIKRQNRNEELLNLDKRIWNDLEVQIRETCEKTDFLYHSGDESGDSLTDIIDQLLVPFEDSEITPDDSQEGIYNDATFPKHPDRTEHATSGHEHSHLPRRKDDPHQGKAGNDLQSLTAKSHEEPASKKVKEISNSTKAVQQSKAEKPQSKLAQPTDDPNLKSASGESEVEIREEMFDDNDDCDYNGGEPQTRDREAAEGSLYASTEKPPPLSPGFFKSHENVGFIGKSVDEAFVSFELDDVTLYQPFESQMLIYDIANCTATHAYLKMCRMKYKTVWRKNAEQMSPSGKVPFICSGLCIIPEFEGIVSFMQYKKFTCIRVEESDKAAFRSFLSMVVDTLEMSERYICWYDEATLMNYTKPKVGAHYPFPLNYIMNWRKRYEERRQLSDQGIPRKSLDIILREINNCFGNLSQRLGDNNFFFGDSCTELDALVYGHIYALFTVDLEGPFRDMQFIVQQFPNLMNFAIGFDKRFSLDKFAPLDLSYWDNIAKVGSDVSFCPKATD